MTLQFDYIIVGAGSAGCVLANRLSEDPGVSVLLLEAGGSDNHPFTRIPLGFAKTFGNAQFDWRYSYGPETALDGRQIYCPRGKTLGGSSSINGLAYVRGHRADFDHWRAQGNDGWGWDDVLPYFTKSETYALRDTEARGRTGPLSVEPAPFFHPMNRHVMSASIEAGLAQCEDYNTPDPEGLARMQVTVRRGARSSAATAYLKPAMHRNNLRVETHAHVQRLECDGRRATGIVFTQGDKALIAIARRDVILSAGAANSPKILELSGIGQGDHLKRIGIAVLRDLPGVGENLQDHSYIPTHWRLRNTSSLNEQGQGWRLLMNMMRYALMRGGLLSSTVTQLAGYARIEASAPSGDIQFLAGPATYAPVQLKDGTSKMMLEKKPGFSLGFYQCRPDSRGHVHAASHDPAAAPKIVGNFLAQERDQRIAIAGLKLCRRIMNQSAMHAYREGETSPGAAVATEQTLLAYARGVMYPAYHMAGTCKMGPATDRMSVVNSRLQVHSVENLRVIDASVMPQIVSANTNAATIMIAERAADLIRSGT